MRGRLIRSGNHTHRAAQPRSYLFLRRNHTAVCDTVGCGIQILCGSSFKSRINAEIIDIKACGIAPDIIECFDTHNAGRNRLSVRIGHLFRNHAAVQLHRFVPHFSAVYQNVYFVPLTDGVFCGHFVPHRHNAGRVYLNDIIPCRVIAAKKNSVPSAFADLFLFKLKFYMYVMRVCDVDGKVNGRTRGVSFRLVDVCASVVLIRFRRDGNLVSRIGITHIHNLIHAFRRRADLLFVKLRVLQNGGVVHNLGFCHLFGYLRGKACFEITAAQSLFSFITVHVINPKLRIITAAVRPKTQPLKRGKGCSAWNLRVRKNTPIVAINIIAFGRETIHQVKPIPNALL